MTELPHRVFYHGGVDERMRRLHGHVARWVLADEFPDLPETDRTVILRTVAFFGDPQALGPVYPARGLFGVMNDSAARLSPRGQEAFAKVFDAITDASKAARELGVEKAEDLVLFPPFKPLLGVNPVGIIGVSRAPNEIVTAPIYHDPPMDTAAAYAAISRETGLPVSDLRKLVADAQKRAAKVVTQRAKAEVRARHEMPDDWKPPALPLPKGLRWPVEQFDQSPEFRKHGGIERHLERVWKPLIAVGVVHMGLLRTFYPSTAQGIDNYRTASPTARKNGQPRPLPPDLDIPLVSPGSGRHRTGAQPQAVPA